jgi:hypothetical protein
MQVELEPDFFGGHPFPAVRHRGREHAKLLDRFGGAARAPRAPWGAREELELQPGTLIRQRLSSFAQNLTGDATLRRRSRWASTNENSSTPIVMQVFFPIEEPSNGHLHWHQR